MIGAEGCDPVDPVLRGKVHAQKKARNAEYY